MIDTLDPLLKHLPPKTKTALLTAINACAKQLNLGPDWVQRWLSFTVVADALASYAPSGTAVFEFKGGAAIEMRLHRLHQPAAAAKAAFRPRATKDLDAAFHGEMDELQRSKDSCRAQAARRRRPRFECVDERGGSHALQAVCGTATVRHAIPDAARLSGGAWSSSRCRARARSVRPVGLRSP